MRKDSFANPRVITFLNPHIYVSRPYHTIFNEKSIWICKMRAGFLQGRGETPKQAYDSWAKLHLNSYSNKYERLGKERQVRKILEHGGTYGTGALCEKR